ncbi:hypothetical protein PPL_06109 [Heterostelium album PN500]|uniref:Uncharacterized protein n=1 Tax=Heterostelium pallidum (strain ATCC 26659 / Pp 5 / PN500) TaxID=670386 RepID=D3BC86_HETP5|nr:hypothetical protein PPL_06109 [Heterostelium album PN500]EFA81269.1 hypothetical protein PPL_06109 [Heterostelium album PN500]|eukprot:XP_020433387.1 hypothetical protein PPL_06109 [Heterostelium album PN500]
MLTIHFQFIQLVVDLIRLSTSTSNIQPVTSSSTIVDAQSSNNNVDEATLQQEKQKKEKEKEIQLKLQQQLQSEQQIKCDVGWRWGQRFLQ